MHLLLSKCLRIKFTKSKYADNCSYFKSVIIMIITVVEIGEQESENNVQFNQQIDELPDQSNEET